MFCILIKNVYLCRLKLLYLEYCVFMSYFSEKIKNSDIFSHLSSMGYLPRWMVLVMDLLLCVVAYYCAHNLAYYFYYFKYAGIDLYDLQNLLIILGCQMVCFWIFHTYAGIIRYSTFVDATKLLLAIVANVVILLLINS